MAAKHQCWPRVDSGEKEVVRNNSRALRHIVHARSPAYDDVQYAVSRVPEGGTVIVPAGTASWTQPFILTKSITLKGATTTSGAGTANATANDQTIILDDSPPTGQTGLLIVHANTARITGFTFRHGQSTTHTGDGAIRLNADVTPGHIRIDHYRYPHPLACAPQ